MEALLEALQDEVHRKLGRNVLLFQEFETLLKCLLIGSQISGRAGDLQTALNERIKDTRRKTMGQLIEPLLKNITTQPEEIKISDSQEEPYIICGFTLQDFYKNKKSTLDWVVIERNELIHHFWQRWDFNSVEGLKLAEQYLDQQHIKIEPELQNLRKLVQDIDEDRKLLANFMISNEGRYALKIMALQQSPLVNQLSSITVRKARNDGWTLLDIGANFVKKQFPEELNLLKKQYGCKTLKNLMLKTELFDFYNEPTTKGGTRVLYRIKPHLLESPSI